VIATSRNKTLMSQNEQDPLQGAKKRVRNRIHKENVEGMKNPRQG